MTILIFGVLTLALVALLAFREWLAYRERQEWAQERRLLITRIQSPELAPMLAPRPPDEPPEGPPTEQEEIMAVVRGDDVNGDG